MLVAWGANTILHRRVSPLTHFPPFQIAQTSADRVLRVFLADSLQDITTGGGHTYTLRDEIRKLKEVDVIIDASIPLLAEIIEWCEKVVHRPNPSSDIPPRTILFHTSNKTYFKFIKEILAAYDFNVVDRSELERDESYACPRLIYQHTTAETINSEYRIDICILFSVNFL